METITKEFTEACVERMEENLEKIIKSLAHLEEEQIWWRPNEHSNSIGNQILHLCGNIRQYAIATLGEVKDIRQRDEEFSTQGGLNKNELSEQLTNTVLESIQQMKAVQSDRLLKIYPVQAYEMSSIRIMLHVVEHFSYHTGQIALLTKLLKNIDLGFYANIDLNQK